jgi:hypothetical protein
MLPTASPCPTIQHSPLSERSDSLCELTKRYTELYTCPLANLIQELDEPGEISGLTADGVVGFAREVIGKDIARSVLVGNVTYVG